MKHSPARYSRRLAAISILVCMIATAAQAQTSQTAPQELKQLSLEQLGNLEVTTKSKAPEQVWKTAAAIYVITQDDIRRSGVTTIAEALRLAPGVEVARINANQWAIGIRGFGSGLTRSVLVLIDGRSVYSTLIAGTYWQVQDTVLEDIDRIEVIRGPGGTVWGPNAVQGVINIITKNSKDTQGALVSSGGGNYEQGFMNMRYGGSHGNLSYRVYGKGFNRGSEFHFNGDNYDRWGAAQGGFRVDWNKSQQDAFTLQGDLYHERAGGSAQLSSYTPPYLQNVEGYQLFSGGNLLARWTRTFRDGEDIQIQAYFDRTNLEELNFGDQRSTFDVDYIQRRFLGSRNHLSWGLGARSSRGHESEVTSGLFFAPSMRTDLLYTAFLQDSIAIVPSRLTLEIGGKLLKTNYTGVEPQPSVRLLWTPTETETIWMAATRAVRTPSDGERDFFLSSFIGTSGGLPFFARFNANPDFQSEKLNSYELGYRTLLGKSVYLDLATFFNHYHDAFSEDITGPTTTETAFGSTHRLIPAQFRNDLYGSTVGGEIAPEWRPTTFWRLRGSYSFLHIVLKKSPGTLDVGTPPGIAGSSPQHQVLAQSSLDLPKRIAFDFNYRFESALPALGIPAYSTADARLAWMAGSQWEFSALGDNLFQPHHVEFDPGVGIKRSFYGKVVWRSKGN